MINVQVKNLEALQRKLKELPKRAREALEAGITAKAGEAMNAAQKTVPVRTGRLRASAYIEKRKRNQHRTDLEFGYRAPYALFVHEHPYSRGYKWFQRAVQKVFNKGAVDAIWARVIRAVKRR